MNETIIFILGVLCGLVIATLNVLAYKKEVQTKIKGFFTRKAEIIDIKNPLDNIDLT